ncbi:MAG: hypothetical protein ABS81_16465 [Pseudonocardia sp. SCN 72-86]|nr:MAG: hypothetical protein ABS81_16465 [Pseudonocardia sp. SCN 72-86]
MLSNVPARFAESAAGMAIDRENVLQVGAVLVGEVRRLRQVLQAHGGDRMELCGGDPVSADAKQAFNQRAEALVALYKTYVDDLQALSDAVAEAARSYGVADADIATVFRR